MPKSRRRKRNPGIAAPSLSVQAYVDLLRTHEVGKVKAVVETLRAYEDGSSLVDLKRDSA